MKNHGAASFFECSVDVMMSRESSSEYKQGSPHKKHAYDYAAKDKVMVPVALGIREKFVKRDVDHDSGHSRHTYRINHRRPERQQEQSLHTLLMTN